MREYDEADEPTDDDYDHTDRRGRPRDDNDYDDRPRRPRDDRD